jgi:Xaa-Pro aminopeptidase
VVIDLVPRYQGYCANLCRTFVIGSATDEQRALVETYEAARTAARRAMRPGVEMRQIDAAAKAAFEKTGYGEFYVVGISHGIGLSFEETPAPTIKPAEGRVPVREGMVLTVGHTVLSVPGLGGVRIENTYHISPRGPVALTDFPAELVVRS